MPFSHLLFWHPTPLAEPASPSCWQRPLRPGHLPGSLPAPLLTGAPPSLVGRPQAFHPLSTSAFRPAHLSFSEWHAQLSGVLFLCFSCRIAWTSGNQGGAIFDTCIKWCYPRWLSIAHPLSRTGSVKKERNISQHVKIQGLSPQVLWQPIRVVTRWCFSRFLILLVELLQEVLALPIWSFVEALCLEQQPLGLSIALSVVEPFHGLCVPLCYSGCQALLRCLGRLSLCLLCCLASSAEVVAVL